MTSTEVMKRNVKVETGSVMMVEQPGGLTLADVRDFVHTAEAHGVTDETKVHVKETSEKRGNDWVVTTKFLVDTPVVLAYGSSQRPLQDPRKRRLRRRAVLLAAGAFLAFMLVPVALLFVGLVLHFIHLAYGWL